MSADMLGSGAVRSKLFVRPHKSTMKVRYRLPVTGTLRLEYSFPVEAGFFTYTFEVNDYGVVTHLNATAKVSDAEHWPRIDYTPDQPVKASINLRSPYFGLLIVEVRAAAGALSIFGVEDISTASIEEFWEPETPEERSSLKLYSFNRTTEQKSPEHWPYVPFDLAARALMTAERTGQFDAALNFYRKGRIDMKSHSYIDAVLDFLFMIETTFANGKIKSAQVKEEYLSSLELRQLVDSALKEKGLVANLQGDNRIQASFNAIYLGKQYEEIVSHLVDLRGQLHHHTSRKKGVWHPMDHVRFGADAYFLQHVCFGIAFSALEATMFNDETASNFQRQQHQHARSGTLKVHRK